MNCSIKYNFLILKTYVNELIITVEDFNHRFSEVRGENENGFFN